MPHTLAERVAAAKQRIENLTPAQVTVEVEHGNALLVDIREPEELRALGVIPGALPAPYSGFGGWTDPASPVYLQELTPERRVILHCASGVRSALAADALRQAGFANVAHLDGGFTAWEAADLPVTEAPSETAPAR